MATPRINSGDPLEILRDLASHAANEPMPHVDISEVVLHRLRLAFPMVPVAPLRQLKVFTMATVAAAGVSAVLWILLIRSICDPVLFLVAVP
jgi:hypothetical protein